MKWLAADEAAVFLGHITINHVRVLAHREGWRKQRAGKSVRYALDDVSASRERRMRMQDPGDGCNRPGA